MVSTTLCTKYTWPPRRNSRSAASRSVGACHSVTKVLMASRSAGGVVISDRSRRPPSAMFSVRGIGVAVSVSTCTSARSVLSFSLSRTPKRCSSSTMMSPRSLKRTLACSSRCVAMTMSTVPFSMPSSTAFDSLPVRKRDSDLDAHRPVGEAIAEVVGVLLGEQRGGHQHRDLLAGLRGDERGAHRHFGLAEAHVAAHHAIHRLLAREVLQHLADGLGLVGGFLERKAAREGLVFELALRHAPARVSPGAARTGRAVPRPRRGSCRRRVCAPWPIDRCRACAAARFRARRPSSARPGAAAARARTACRRRRIRAPRTRRPVRPPA